MTKEEEFLTGFRQLGPKDQKHVAALARQRLAEAQPFDCAQGPCEKKVPIESQKECVKMSHRGHGGHRGHGLRAKGCGEHPRTYG
jgi:hypothetical protein